MKQWSGHVSDSPVRAGAACGAKGPIAGQWVICAQQACQTTVNAPLFTVTAGPTSVIAAPLPFWM